MDHTLIAQGAGTMDPVTIIKAASLVGSGIAAVGVIGPGVGIGIAGSRALEGMARQPEMATKLLVNAIIIAALMEALGLLAFVIAIQLYNFGTAAPAEHAAPATGNAPIVRYIA
ncbi:MAG: ATP synthase F0 subunit C [Candidatus Obscuribacterales bacterium]|nr:ATP synthase F0 subunit C [Candidatus Obscuribacterales bacterium]